jgi:SNF2 family DNA or RNA helicase
MYYYIEHFHVKSYSLFRDIINASHPFRSHLVIRCSDEYIQTSISLPPLIRSIVQCKAPISHQIIRDAITPDIQQKLNAGDVVGALEGLGVKGTDTRTLIEAVTANLQKELVRLKKIYDFKESLEYSSAAAKTTALESLQDKINKTTISIQAIQERIESAQADICPICYDEPTNSIVTPCCARFFCGGCLLTSMSVNPHCPLCRSSISPSSCTKIVTTADMNTIVAGGSQTPDLEKKQDALLRILQENPQGRFLVFSRYDNPFESLESTMETMGIKVKQLKGNKDAIAATLRSFESGALRCLLLNSEFAGSGLNITAATHVILLHAMSREEEKQILGRAYRIGREGPLQYIKLLHNGEESYADETQSIGGH